MLSHIIDVRLYVLFRIEQAKVARNSDDQSEDVVSCEGDINKGGGERW